MRRPTAPQALVLEGFTSRLSFGLLTFALPLYGRALGMSIAQVGLLASFSVMVSLALKPLAGVAADRMGLKRALVLSLALRSLLSLGYAVTVAPWQVFVVRGAHGASDSLRDPSVHALLAETGSSRRMATTFAWYQTAKTSAGALGKSLAGLLLVGAGSFTPTFLVAFGLSVFPLVLVALLVPSVQRPVCDRAGNEAPHHEPGARTADVAQPVGRRGPGVLAYAVLGFLVSGTSAMLTALFPIIATEYAGLNAAQAGALYLLTPLLALTGPLWGLVSDRVSRPLVLSFRSIANIGSATLFLLAPNPAGMWGGKCLDDLGKAAFRPAWGSLMADVSARDPRRRARTMAYLTSGEDAGDIAAPIVAGLIWTGWGIPALLVTRIVIAVVTEGYTLWLEGRSRVNDSSPFAPPRTPGSREAERQVDEDDRGDTGDTGDTGDVVLSPAETRGRPRSGRP